MKLGETMEG